MLMTATPFISDPIQLIKLLNLITDTKMPEDFSEFSKEYLEDGVKFSYKGINKFVSNIYKNISYLNATKDNSMFAIQVKNDII